MKCKDQRSFRRIWKMYDRKDWYREKFHWLLSCKYQKLFVVSVTADEAIREIFHVISTGTSSEKDDEQLVKLIKEEIVRTAYRVKTPSGSIEAAARRAQRLVTELTAAYTTTIYKSKSSEEAKVNFARFRNTVQKIVDFIKNGQFVV